MRGRRASSKSGGVRAYLGVATGDDMALLSEDPMVNGLAAYAHAADNEGPTTPMFRMAHGVRLAMGLGDMRTCGDGHKDAMGVCSTEVDESYD